MPTTDEKLVINAVKKITPAVVSIIISKYVPEIQRSPLELFGFDFLPEYAPPKTSSGPKRKIRVGGGSGFIVDKDGIILTNRHVVSDPEAEYTIITQKGEKYPAKILARDSINDVAIIKINAKNLPVVELGDSSQIEIGQTVIAIGTALGEFAGSVSKGIISGLSRFITAMTGLGEQERLRGLIQTDAAINPGNSGGPLVNLEGKTIGINTAVVFGAENIGFAIPINAAKKDLNDLKKYGHIRKPSLGVRYLLINKKIQKEMNLPLHQGALIIRETGPGDVAIIPGSPADKAGIKENDIILEVNGQKIDLKNTLQDLINGAQVDQEIILKILRAGKEKTVKTKLAESK
ncbi:MAG: trypsin-like peptidase domain-containing protein [Parcubacteria group bacterium]|nr:trypsin-like peptidase domain-containing protein [Parcubacteria group bacterium]